MDREEFLEILKTALAGEVSQAVLLENLNYYDEYIMTEIRKGRSEGEVMEELGNPRLIAKTIIDTHSGTGYEPRSYAYEAYEETESGEDGGKEAGYGGKVYRLSGWQGKLLLAVILIVVVVAVGALLSFLLPFLLIVAVVALAASVIRNIMNR